MNRIICSAIYINDGKSYIHQPFNIKEGFVICGLRHHNCLFILKMLNLDKNIPIIQGFLTIENNFVNRKEAVIIAFDAGQISKLKKELCSEDLY